MKHVITEKPLAVGVKAGEMLAARAAKTGTVHMVGYHKRSDPATQYAMDVITGWKKSGEMGKLRYVRILMPAGDWTANGLLGVLSAGDEPSQPIVRESAAMTDLPGAKEGEGAWNWKGLAGSYVGFVSNYFKVFIGQS